MRHTLAPSVAPRTFRALRLLVALPAGTHVGQSAAATNRMRSLRPQHTSRRRLYLLQHFRRIIVAPEAAVRRAEVIECVQGVGVLVAEHSPPRTGHFSF